MNALRINTSAEENIKRALATIDSALANGVSEQELAVILYDQLKRLPNLARFFPQS